MTKRNALIKAVVSVSLSLLMVFSSFPSLIEPVLAAQDGDFTYELIDSGTNVSITKYTGTSSNVDIPSMLEGKNVTSIGQFAFSSYNSLVTVTIPNSVTSIGQFAFSNCTSLTAVTIPNAVTSIDQYAFNFCSSLTMITIPNGVISIGMSAFSNCSNVTTITISSSVVSIGTQAFLGCSSLATINVEETNTNYSSVDGILFNIGKTILVQYPVKKTETTYLIPDSVTAIGESAFYGCSNLVTVTIPDSVTYIGSGAFGSCSSLTTIAIPNSVTSIGENVFSGCSSITTITIPNSIVSISAGTFWKCSNLATITVPNSVTSIGDNAFGACTSLSNITIPASVTSIGDNAFGACTSLSNITIPASVTSIGIQAFSECTSLPNITIPVSVTSIGNLAFGGCSNLYTINVEENNTNYSSIDGILFDINKTKLIQYPAAKTEVVYIIPASVTAIGDYAFSDSSNLTTITIPISLKSIGSNTLSGCGSLTAINVDENNTKYSSTDGVLFNKKKTQIIRYPSGKTAIVYSIPNSVTSMGSAAFEGCSSLTTITIPESIKSISASAFAKCTNLTTIIIPNIVTDIGSSAFSGCSNLTAISIPNSVTSIGFSTFRDCTSLTSITIPYSISMLNSGTFSGCNNLAAITIPNTVTYISWDALFNCPNVTIYGEENSFAQQYATGYNIPFIVTVIPTPTAIPSATTTPIPTATPTVAPTIAPTATPTPTLDFTDLVGFEWAHDAISNLANVNVIVGYGDSTFRPGNNITRAEFTKMLTVSFGLCDSNAVYDPGVTYEGIFTDVQNGEWYASYIETAYNEGIVKGTGEGIFKPDAYITRQEITTIISNAIAVLHNTTVAELAKDYELTFTDTAGTSDWAKDNDWAINGIKVCSKLGIINGYPEGTFQPVNSVTRAESAVMADNFINYIIPAPTPTPTPTATPTPEPRRLVKVATTCVKLRLGSQDANMTEILKLVDKTAIGCNPDVIVLSESILTRGNPVDQIGQTIPGPYSNALAAKCVQYNCSIVFNVNEITDGKLYNTNIMLDRTGQVVGKYKKFHVPQEELDMGIVPGTEYPVFDTEFGKVGMEICYDFDPAFNNDVTTELKNNGAEIIFASSIGDYTFSAKQAAEDNGIYIVMAGQDQYMTGQNKYDVSAIIDQTGEIIAGVTDRTGSVTTWPEMQYKDGDGSYAFATIDLGPAPTATPVP